MGLYSRETWEIYPCFDRVKQTEKRKNYSDFEITRQLEVEEIIKKNRRIILSYAPMYKTGV